MTRAGAHPFPKQLGVVSQNTFLSKISPQKYEGSLNNGTASMGSSLIGAVNASTGGSKLVGASSLTGNTTNNKNSWLKQGLNNPLAPLISALNSFGDLRLNGTGQSMGGLISNNSIGPDGTVRGVVGAQGMGNGANKSIAVNDGLQSADGKGNSQGSNCIN
jgi:hypothetical protein